jgi:peptidoglycan/LPS O-acetylase OafA/YrhL
MSQANNDRLIGIELLRFLAAFAVLVWHYQNFLIGSPGHPELVPAAQPLSFLLAPLYAYGNSGVELFWCLSGFIFTWKYTEPIHAGGVSFARFIWLRFSRLYPLHFATLLLVAALNAVYFARRGEYFMYPVNDLKHFLLNLGFASYWGFQADKSFNGPIWSVSVEILVYFVFFAVSRVRRGNLWTDIGMTILASIAYAGLRRYAGIKLEVFGAITFFYIGAASCRIHAMLAERSDRRPAIAVTLGIVLVSGALVGAGVLKIAGASLAMFPAAILFFQLAVRPSGARVAGAIEAVGNLTYASYLIHFPLQIAMVLVLDALSVPAAGLFYGPWLLPAYLILVLGLSVPVFQWFERPAQTLLRGLGRPRYAAPRLPGAEPR